VSRTIKKNCLAFVLMQTAEQCGSCSRSEGGRVRSKRNNICKVISYNVVDETRRLLHGLVFHVSSRTGFVNGQKQMKVALRCVDIVRGC
jgi:hypothetical protein